MSDNETKYPWRVFGLGFAIGEALRYSYGRSVVAACSTIACTYIVCRALRQGIKSEGNFMPAAGDSLVFDIFASALIPSFITYNTCRFTYRAIKDFHGDPESMITWGPTLAGLLILCVTVDAVDKLVNDVMDKTLRKSNE